MFGRSIESKIIRSSDEITAIVDFIHNGKTPDKIYGQVHGNGLRDVEFIPSSPEAIAQHNTRAMEIITQKARQPRLTERVRQGFAHAAVLFTAGLHR